MTRNNEPTQRLTNAAELLEMLEHIFASRGSSSPQGSEFPWSGVKLTLSLAREQLEAARADLGTNGPTPGRSSSNRIETPVVSQAAGSQSAITASTIIGSSHSAASQNIGPQTALQPNQPQQAHPLAGRPPVHGATNSPLNFQGSANPQAPAAAALASPARAESPVQPRNLTQQHQTKPDPSQSGLSQGQPERRAREQQSGISPSLASRIQRVPVRTEQVPSARPDSRSGEASPRAVDKSGNAQRNGEQRSVEPRNGGQQGSPARNGTPRPGSPARQERPVQPRPSAGVNPQARSSQVDADQFAGQSSGQPSGSAMGIAKLGRVREIDPEAFDYDEPEDNRPDSSAAGSDREGASRKSLVANQKSV